MERNIVSSLKRGQRIPCCDVVVPQPSRHYSAIKTTTTNPARTAVPRSRTLSGMDEVLLQQFSIPAPVKPPQPSQPPQVNHNNIAPQSKPRDAHGRPPLNPVSMGRASSSSSSATAATTLPPSDEASLLPFDLSERSLEFSPEKVERNHPLTREDSGELELRGVALLDGPLEDDDALCDVIEDGPKNQHQQHQHVRRNTGGTIYMKSTMMNPDIKATIKVSWKFGLLSQVFFCLLSAHMLSFAVSLVHSVSAAFIVRTSCKHPASDLGNLQFPSLLHPIRVLPMSFLTIAPEMKFLPWTKLFVSTRIFMSAVKWNMTPLSCH